MNMKKELWVTALQNGTVIDHIPPKHLFEVVSILGLHKETVGITIGFNLASSKIGKKGIIKIADRYYEKDQINRIALIAPNVRLSVIRNYEVCEKIHIEIPDELNDIARCPNPKCITNNEPMTTRFKVVDHDEMTFKCRYCRRVIEKADLKLL